MKISKPTITIITIAAIVLAIIVPLTVFYLAYHTGVTAERQEIASSLDRMLADLDPPTVPQDTESPLITIVSINSRIMETNSIWWKYAWVLTVRNETDASLSMDARIEWLDSDGFVVDNDTGYGLYLKAKEQAVFRGNTLITASSAPNVSSLNASLHRR